MHHMGDGGGHGPVAHIAPVASLHVVGLPLNNPCPLGIRGMDNKITVIQFNPSNFQLFVGTQLFAIGSTPELAYENALDLAETNLAVCSKHQVDEKRAIVGNIRSAANGCYRLVTL